jgi:hypothetical protein
MGYRVMNAKLAEIPRELKQYIRKAQHTLFREVDWLRPCNVLMLNGGGGRGGVLFQL